MARGAYNRQRLLYLGRNIISACRPHAQHNRGWVAAITQVAVRFERHGIAVPPIPARDWRGQSSANPEFRRGLSILAQSPRVSRLPASICVVESLAPNPPPAAAWQFAAPRSQDSY